MNRGRPRLVLTSVAVMDDLCEPHAQDEGVAAHAALTALLDASREMIVLVDTDMRIVALSRSARAHFGQAAQAGAPLSLLIAGQGGEFACDTALRTLQSGLPETIEIGSAHRPGRRLSIATEPHPAGVALLIRDVTDQHRLGEAHAGVKALQEAIGVSGLCATAGINGRGVVQQPDAALMKMTGLAATALADLRFANLIEIRTRVSVMEAVDAVLSTGTPRAVDALLLVARADPLPVRISLGALYEGATITAALALIISRAD